MNQVASTNVSGSGSGPSGVDASGAPPRKTLAFGPVTSFDALGQGHGGRLGRILSVNQRGFDLETARISVNNRLSTSTEALKPGNVFDISADLVDDDVVVGLAVEINFQANAVGPISRIDVDEDQKPSVITILGQTVKVNEQTIYDEAITAAGGLKEGDVVSVSGLREPAGGASATRIEYAAEGQAMQVLGRINTGSLDSEGQNFDVANLKVGYGGAVLEGVTLDESNVILVQGDSLDENGQLIAKQIYPSSLPDKTNFDTVDVTGVASSLVDNTFFLCQSEIVTKKERVIYQRAGNTFFLCQSEIVIDENTEITSGKVGDISFGAVVNVIGEPNNFGQVVAKQLAVTQVLGKFSTSGSVVALGTDSHTVELDSGLIAYVDEDTLLASDPPAGGYVIRITFEDLAVGDRLNLTYDTDEQGKSTAVRIYRDL